MSNPLEPTGTIDEVVSSPPRARAGMFATLRVGAFLRLWLGSTIVFLGVMAQSIARSWLAFDLTGSSAALGGVLMAFGVAMIVATPWGGVAADRLPKRMVLQVAIGLLTFTSAWIGLAVLFDVIAYWMLLAASVIQAVAFALYNPARMAFITQLVPADDVPDAVALMLVNAEVSRVAGPALAGVVIASLSYGTEAVFLCCAVLFAVGLAVGFGLPRGSRAEPATPRSPLGEMADGLGYVRRRGELTGILVCTFCVVMIGLPYLAFLPAVSDGLFDAGSAGYGILSAVSALGAVIAGMLLGGLRRRLNSWHLLIAAGVLFGVGILVLAATPSFLVAAVILVPLGGGLLMFQTLGQAMLMSLSDVEFHGRIQSLVMLSFGAFGIAALPLGLMADAFGLRGTFAAMGGGVLLTMVVFGFASRGHWARTTVREPA
ncbi:MFS transporter [Streptosporangium sp. NPDC002544]|uniref:MFS transporter n=1 Tax=Streptosporangium sp. NPDC002544 TaxID=3154538 RepID=UPI003322534F